MVSAVYDASAWTNASLWRGALAGRGGPAFFADHARGDAVERESYRALRYLETPEKRRHGASVMTQVLNAYPPFGGSGQRMSEPASDWPLIFVQFPENEVERHIGRLAWGSCS